MKKIIIVTIILTLIGVGIYTVNTYNSSNNEDNVALDIDGGATGNGNGTTQQDSDDMTDEEKQVAEKSYNPEDDGGNGEEGFE